MELVYLWVENYKNIKNQGFNFSSKFECEFKAKYYSKANNEGKLKEALNKKSLLSIIPKSLESLLPTNVNIITIVGKNGTGKSRILKLLYSLYNNSLEKNINCFAIFYDVKQKEYFYFGDENKFECLKQYTKLSNTAFALFDYSLTYQPEFYYAEEELIYPKKKINSVKGAISLTQELIRNQKNILFNYFELAKNNHLNKFRDFFVAEQIVIEFNNTRFQKVINDKKGLLENKKQKIISIISSISVGQSLKDFIRKLKEIQIILNDKNSFEEKQSFPFDNYFFQNWFQWCESMDEDNQINNLWSKDFINLKIWNKFIKDKKITPQKLYKEIVEEEESNIPSYEVLSCKVKNLTQELIEVILISLGKENFTIKLIDKNGKALDDLSFGEQQLIFILNQLFTFKNAQLCGEDRKPMNYENYIVLLDEIDIGFHPDWQKRVIQYICDFLKLIPEKNFHLVFTTHSPFLLSDIPNEKVIFLDKIDEKTKEKYPILDIKGLENGNCINVSKYKEFKTFGANIHTLLSDGFFMSDGLIGEFAKNKITEILEYLNDTKNEVKLKTIDDKQIKTIIDSIGEDFLRNKLLNLYYKKFNTDKQKRIKELKNELKRLKK